MRIEGYHHEPLPKSDSIEVVKAVEDVDPITQFDGDTEGVIGPDIERDEDSLRTESMVAEAEGSVMQEEVLVDFDFTVDNGRKAKAFIESHPVTGFVADVRLVEQIKTGELIADDLEERALQNRVDYAACVDTLKYYQPNLQLPSYAEALQSPEIVIKQVWETQLGIKEGQEGRSHELLIGLADRFQNLVFVGENLNLALNQPEAKAEQPAERQVA